jgi:hypothetical protein
MWDAIGTIKQYILDPDSIGQHLRQMVEEMAKAEMASDGVVSPRHSERESYLERSAVALATFIHLAWGPVEPAVFASRTLEILHGLQQRMRGMDPDATWAYAITAFNRDIRYRLQRADAIKLDPEMETELIHHFHDSMPAYDYLHDVAEHIERLHWERRHSHLSTSGVKPVATSPLVGPRSDPSIAAHLRRAAIGGLATYIEQSNIIRGRIEEPTDPRILLRDRIDIQRLLGAKNVHTWEAAGQQLADRIESRFGTIAGRREARQVRGIWTAIDRRHRDSQSLG